MEHLTFFVACIFALLTCAASSTVEYTFNVGNLTVSPLCKSQTIVAVNNQFPGPTINVNRGDTLVVHVFNFSPYKISIHWHGIFQIQTPWADGPSYVTQCPIAPGSSYTYRFTITGQEGTLWWHAHFSTLRATVYGALIIKPQLDRSYRFAMPDAEIPILLGEWWNANVVDVENQALAAGGGPNISDAFTINGMPGALYSCPNGNIGTFKVTVEQGKTYLLRIINAALNNQLFFKVASHTFMVVAIDASYTTPYRTDVIVIAPGQTVDALLVANQSPASYYMAARAYASASIVAFDNTTTTAILQYQGATSSIPTMPVMPAYNDTPTAHTFYSNITGLPGPVPRNVDEDMFITIGLGLTTCPEGATCPPFGKAFAASMNNASFQLPSATSMLEAQFSGNTAGVFTEDFPSAPPVVFDYTNGSVSLNMSLLPTVKGTRVKALAFDSVVQIVLQNTALISTENHPIHLHGFNFYVLAQGFGNYDSVVGPKLFNLVNPQVRNTIAVPVGGWAVIRFTANNPGVWFMHCHLDAHLPWGLAMAFVVENGVHVSLPPPPSDLPHC